MRQRALLAFFLLSGLALAAMAQRPRYDKMSPLVREACLLSSGGDAPAGAKAYGQAGRGRTITAFVKTDDGGRALAGHGCRVLARYGDLCVAAIPTNALGRLSRQKGVLRIEAGSRAKATMDTTAFIVGATALHEGFGLPQGYTGKGVVVGVQDIGFDLTHPNFWSADMSRYRIKALWDQLSTDTVCSRLPAGRDYRDSLSLLTLGRPRDGDIQAHGTHTAGIAAGSGGEGAAQSQYVGIAPDADLCLVCNATSDDEQLIDSADQYKYTYALDALGFKYIFDYADSVGKPCVINFSEGSPEDLRGDDVLYYEMLDSLTGPGRIIVASAGNEGQKVNYLHKPADADSAAVYATSRWHTRTFSFTTRSTGGFSLGLALGGASKVIGLDDVLAAADSTLTDSIVAGGVKYRIKATAYPDCYDPARVAADWVVTSAYYIYPNVFYVRLTGDADVELFPSTALLGNNGSITEAKGDEAEARGDGDNSHSVFSPGSAPSVICVGMTGYRDHFTNWLGGLMTADFGTGGERSTASSVGPTWDGRVKPDVMAPGGNIISSYSSYYIEANPDAGDIGSDVRHFTYNGRTYAWNANSGTSMSSPVVAGVVALWLQAYPKLTPHDCMDIIAKTSTRYDDSLDYPNNLYGYGQIDAEAGMRLVLEKKAAGIKGVRTGKAATETVYTLDGRCLGIGTQGLPKGIYVKAGKKIIVR